MNLNVADWVQVIAFGALLGAAGQIVRVVAGLKKLNEKANEKGVAVAQLFSTSQFVFSVLIGAVAGLLGALSLGINPKDLIATDKLLTLLGMGYAGADFIEAFMTKHGGITGEGAGAGVLETKVAPSSPQGGSPPSAGMATAASAVDKSGLPKPKEEAVG
jgi:hypothetical protein